MREREGGESYRRQWRGEACVREGEREEERAREKGVQNLTIVEPRRARDEGILARVREGGPGWVSSCALGLARVAWEAALYRSWRIFDLSSTVTGQLDMGPAGENLALS